MADTGTQIASVAESSWSSLRHAVRALVRLPAVSVVAILTLAIGIGANAATFSVVHNVLLQPLPYSDPEQIVFLARVSDGAPGSGRWFSVGQMEAFREAGIGRQGTGDTLRPIPDEAASSAADVFSPFTRQTAR